MWCQGKIWSYKYFVQLLESGFLTMFYTIYKPRTLNMWNHKNLLVLIWYNPKSKTIKIIWQQKYWCDQIHLTKLSDAYVSQ